MATKKAGGTAQNLTDSAAKYLGTKLYAGEVAKAGSIIVRQRGTRILAGANVAIGKDHTLYSLKEGIVEFSEKRKQNFDGSTTRRKVASVK
ncbi:MAG: 50S ribosomal protein L27 [Candidatus Yonathbacteria bacterium]|nr:50S ribosomal protein L27 [Candidatus Yonathbacteria bacterium]